MRTTVYNKLVRDRIPEVIVGNGGFAKIRRLPPQRLMGALKTKLLEEVMELQRAKTQAELVAEMADVREVLDALCAAGDIEPKAVTALQREKRRTRGGFTKGIILVSVRE